MSPLERMIDAAAIEVGEELPPLVSLPLGHPTCIRFASASGDFNPIHINFDAARAAGLPDVIGHGMLSMALIGRLLTNWVPQSALRHFDVRFLEATQIGDAVTCTGRIVERTNAGAETLVRVEILAADHHGKMKTLGEALVALPATA